MERFIVLIWILSQVISKQLDLIIAKEKREDAQLQIPSTLWKWFILIFEALVRLHQIYRMSSRFTLNKLNKERLRLW